MRRERLGQSHPSIGTALERRPSCIDTSYKADPRAREVDGCIAAGVSPSLLSAARSLERAGPRVAVGKPSTDLAIKRSRFVEQFLELDDDAERLFMSGISRRQGQQRR